MYQSSEAAEQIVKMGLEGFSIAVTDLRAGAKEAAVILYTTLKDKNKTVGKTKLVNMLKSGKELKVFSVKRSQFDTFKKQAAKYGILYSALDKKGKKSKDDVMDIMVRSEDASKINRIVDRFNLSSYEDNNIRNSIEKTRKETINQKGVQTKDRAEVIKEQEQDKHIGKESNSLNPSLAKTEKSPLSEPIYEKNNYSQKGISRVKPSVKDKLKEYKKIVKENTQSKELQIKDKVITKNRSKRER